MPLIQHQVVDLHPWLSMQQFADIMAIAEMTPGPIAINSATFVGIQVAGLPGAVAATIGCVFPSCVIVMMLVYSTAVFLLHLYFAKPGSLRQSDHRPQVTGLPLWSFY